MLNVGDVLDNGATVFAVLHAGSAGMLIMAKREQDFQPWVVWRVNEGNQNERNQCWGGHYFHNPEVAQANFLERAENLMNLAGFYHENLGV